MNNLLAFLGFIISWIIGASIGWKLRKEFDKDKFGREK